MLSLFCLTETIDHLLKYVKFLQNYAKSLLLNIDQIIKIMLVLIE